MSSLVDFLRTAMTCGTVVFLGLLVLLALPQSKLRSVLLECAEWGATAMLVLLIPSPIDFVPDVIPLAGWADDLGYLVGACMAARSALAERRGRALLRQPHTVESHS